MDKLAYLTELGITGLYLTPIFTAPSDHKYDTTNFFSIDPMFGGDAALKRLIDALHAREMHLTLDAVLNHVSNQHPWFLAAQAGDPDKRDWFTFKPDGSYLCWQDYGPMPELNLSNPDVRDALGAAPDAKVQAASVRLSIAPRSGAVYQAAEPHVNYTYFKPRNRQADTLP